MSMERKFKIGDTVRMTKAIADFDRRYVAETGVVVDFGSIGPRVKFGCGIDVMVFGCTDDQLEMVKEKEKEAEMAKYKVGDLVLVVGPEDPNKISMSDGLSWIPGGMKKFCGRVMRIVSVNEKGRYDLDGGDEWFFVDSWLREYPYDNKPRFQRGDRVECTACIDGKEKGTVVGIDSFGTREGTITYLVRLDDPSSGWSINQYDKVRLDLAGHGIHGDMSGGYWHARESELKRLGDKDGSGSKPEKEKGGNMAKFKAGDKEKLRYKIGDRVIGNEKAKCYGITKTGWVGYVTGHNPGSTNDIRVKGEITEVENGYWVASEAFDLYPEEKEEKKSGTRRVVIEITEDGAKAKYIVGKKVEKEAEIRRYHEDRPDDAKAAKYAVEALFGRLKADEEAERAAKTAEVLRGMNWGDILFRAFCEGTKK